MVCWLRFLERVSDMLRSFEPNLARRKSLAIEILREIEREEGHDARAIERALEREGKAGILKRARKRRWKKSEHEREEEEQESCYEVAGEKAI
ncbi:MAG: hypothetical protein QXG98_05335 [Candidatus Micrarchaeia archaeon]